MRRLTSAILIGGLVAASLLAGCGGGGGGGNGGGGGDGGGGDTQGIVLTGTVENWNPSGYTPAVGVTVKLGNYSGVTNSVGAFSIQLPVGVTVQQMFPSLDLVTPPADYVFSVEPAAGSDGMPGIPISLVQYPKGGIKTYPAEQITGDVNVWWGNTNSFGTIVILY